MQRTFLSRTLRVGMTGALAAAVTLAPLPRSAAHAARARAASTYLTSFTSFHTTFSARNFNPFLIATQLDFTRGAIYEPLEILTTAGGGKTYPYRAPSHHPPSG